MALRQLQPVLTTVGPAAGPVIAAVVTAVLTYLFTGVRDRHSWSRSLSEAHREHYLKFLASWGGASSATLLGVEFGILRANAPIPRRLAHSYERTMTVLRDPGRDAATKQASCRQLQTMVEKLVVTPLSVS